MKLFGEGEILSFWVEEEAYEGVYKIAEKVAEDARLVSGMRPDILRKMNGSTKSAVLFATIGKSPILQSLSEQGKLDISKVAGKREVYGMTIIDHPFDGFKSLCVIYGSDKRGTIYGMFHLSELMGVSPLLYWGDAKPDQKEQMILTADMACVSKEPSVRYRGFFINDEWPCFGNWTMEHFGGFTAEMYDHVFELLLRLKGNYLWPAMWTSSFALDGPGEESAKLADVYGVIMGNSHHEPCLRAGEEWDIYRGTDSIYGNDWNYIKNKEGLLRYWRDGLMRSGKYETIVTIGMRGERDSMMEGPSTLQENIDVLKDIIREQKKLIQNNHPMMLAVYKEVERYFYGDETTKGLKEWEELRDVILLFCEDNFGHMRFLPDETMNHHKGGFGMYYHLDYHGSPVSYEWMNTTNLTAIWEQMTVAYEHGVKDLWIVNVGDLKGNEFPLSYFMELAYDYEKWGIANENSASEYTACWVAQQFGKNLLPEWKTELTALLTHAVEVFARRRFEAIDSHTYHPMHELEANRVLKELKKIKEKTEFFERVLEKEAKIAYESMVYYYLLAGCNLIEMQLYAGKNEVDASRGMQTANIWANKIITCMERDQKLIEEFGEWQRGKWNGMFTGSHIGFTKWNEDGCKNPVCMYVTPVSRPRLAVSKPGEMRLLQKNYGTPDSMEIYDFLDAGVDEIEIELSNTGRGSLICHVEMEPCDWLHIEEKQIEVRVQKILKIRCDIAKLPVEKQRRKVTISDEDTVTELYIHGKAQNMTDVPEGTFFQRNGVISIHAEHYASTKQGKSGIQLTQIANYGLVGNGVRSSLLQGTQPVGDAPTASYYMLIPEEGIYAVELWSAPNNPRFPGDSQPFAIRCNENSWQEVATIPEDYQAGEADCEPWAKGVIEQIHKTKVYLQCKKGVNKIEIGFLQGNFVLEKILVYPKEQQIKESCFGPMESWYLK